MGVIPPGTTGSELTPPGGVRLPPGSFQVCQSYHRRISVEAVSLDESNRSHDAKGRSSVDSQLVEQVRRYWDVDAATYDRDPGHYPVSPLERAAWRGALESLLPMVPASVLDVGAGTGFLSLMVSELGHHVTAVDLSSGMLGRLRTKAEEAGLKVEIVEAEAASVPPGPFDAVISRHLLWTLPEPMSALRAWHDVTPHGRLVLVERLWGDPSSVERIRRWTGQGLARARGTAPAHHASYAPELRAALPLARGASLESLLQLVSTSGWPSPRIRELTDVGWAARRGLPWPERALSDAPEFALVAGT
jgi:SAM-dependent methyltransferase